MSEEIKQCSICGEDATNISDVLAICDNKVCYTAVTEQIKQALNVQGES